MIHWLTGTGISCHYLDTGGGGGGGEQSASFLYTPERGYLAVCHLTLPPLDLPHIPYIYTQYVEFGCVSRSLGALPSRTVIQDRKPHSCFTLHYPSLLILLTHIVLSHLPSEASWILHLYSAFCPHSPQISCVVPIWLFKCLQRRSLLFFTKDESHWGINIQINLPCHWLDATFKGIFHVHAARCMVKVLW